MHWNGDEGGAIAYSAPRQPGLFDDAPADPAGFVYRPDLIDPDEEGVDFKGASPA